MTHDNETHVRQDAYFAMIPEWVLDAHFSPSSIVVYLTLARYANRRTRTCYPAKETIAERCGLSVNTVSRCLAELKDGGAITSKRRNSNGTPTSNVYTLHMIGPFGERPNFESDDQALIPMSEALIPEFDAHVPEVGTQIRQENQTKITKQDISLSISVSGSFDRFWKSYPRRLAKGNARKAYEKAIRTNDPQMILEAAQRYAVAMKDVDPKFIKHPATWLNAECWADEPDPEFTPKPTTVRGEQIDRVLQAKQRVAEQNARKELEA